MNIRIDDKILSITPNFKVGIMSCNIEVYSNANTDKIIQQFEKKINESIDIKDVVNLDIIIDGRNAYKAYGKDPSRYRLAVESLYRRLSKGNKLYKINNVVDCGNILSMKTRKSVAVLDYNKIEGDVLIRLGLESDEYYGIGRGKLNITNIPLYEDESGPFGSVTSDTERTMIRKDTTRILVLIISFSGNKCLEEELNYAVTLYREYAKGKNFKTKII